MEQWRVGRMEHQVRYVHDNLRGLLLIFKINISPDININLTAAFMWCRASVSYVDGLV